MRKIKFQILYKREDGSIAVIDKFGTTEDGLLAYDQRNGKWFCTDLQSGAQAPIPDGSNTTRAQAKHYIDRNCLKAIEAFRRTEKYHDCCMILYNHNARFL